MFTFIGITEHNNTFVIVDFIYFDRLYAVNYFYCTQIMRLFEC